MCIDLLICLCICLCVCFCVVYLLVHFLNYSYLFVICIYQSDLPVSVPVFALGWKLCFLFLGCSCSTPNVALQNHLEQCKVDVDEPLGQIAATCSGECRVCGSAMPHGAMTQASSHRQKAGSERQKAGSERQKPAVKGRRQAVKGRRQAVEGRRQATKGRRQAVKGRRPMVKGTRRSILFSQGQLCTSRESFTRKTAR